MENLYYSEKLYDGSIIYATVLEIYSCPEGFTNGGLSELMEEFGEAGCSYEVILESDLEDGIKCSLMIRMNGYHLEQLQNSFERLMNNVTDRLRYEGFGFVQLSREKVDDTLSRLDDRKHIYMCIPGIRMAEYDLCYVPGGYTNTERLKLSYLMSVLRNADDAGISMQLSYTGFVDIEWQMICANIDWLWNTYGDFPEAETAMEAYRFYQSMGKDKLVFLCVSYWGDDASASKLAHSISSCGYKVIPMPQEVLYKRNYLLEGSRIMTEYYTVYGHCLKQGRIVPQGMERLDYLITARMVDRIVDIEEVLAGRNSDTSVMSLPSVYKDPSGLAIGHMVDTDEQVYLPERLLTKHMTIAGMSGSGKTTLLFKMLIELHKKKLPFLIIEPTKTEHRELMNVIPELQIYTPGRTDISPVMFNPFLPPEGVTLEQYLPSLISAFEMAFSMTTPLDVIFAEAVRNCYAMYGWRNNSTRASAGVKKFGMHEFICAFKEEINSSSYDYESKQNLNSGGVYRLQSLINNNPYLFDTDKTMDFEALLKGCTLIELDAVDNREQKALFMSLLLLQIKLVIRQNQKKDSSLKNVILIDEAHVLLDNGSPAAEKKDADPEEKIEAYLLDMVKVNRVYGTGMIFADQSLAVLKSFVNNSDIKAVMHLEAYEEREFIMNNLNLSEDMYRAIAELGTGEFYISCQDLDRPVKLKLDDVREVYDIPHDISDEQVSARMSRNYETPFEGCPCASCNINVRSEADYIARNVCSRYFSSVTVSQGLDGKTASAIEQMISEMASECKDRQCLVACSRIMTDRMLKRKAALDDTAE